MFAADRTGGVLRPRTFVPVVAVLMAGTALTGCKSSDTASGASSPSAKGSPASPNLVATVPAAGGTPPVAGGPDQATIQNTMTRTVEVAAPTVHFAPVASPVTASDRTGGALTAVVGRRTPTADGHGQLVFFWQGNRFIGWDAETEAMSITKVTGGNGYFTVTYPHYAADDPACCASLPPVNVTYVWQDDGFVPSGGTRPTYGAPVRVKLNP
ncbi:LppP/LprE family lipoprotein [Actinoallomurus iriomotensis]|uniref:LppP/LprE family lipoprotein n=1 Tax=Actinoallomurus TaxID=667113 RepID=UPI0025548D9B|nr:LppP/LprE family lipoprotein [Actinoallomurus iriomotensis]